MISPGCDQRGIAAFEVRLLASPGVTPPVAPGDEFLQSTETVGSHPRMGIGVLEREAEIGGEVGRVADLAFGAEGFRRGRRRTGNDVENGLRIRAAEPGQRFRRAGRQVSGEHRI